MLEVDKMTFSQICDLDLDSIEQWKIDLTKQHKAETRLKHQIKNEILELQRQILEIQLKKKVKEAELEVKEDTASQLKTDIGILVSAFWARKNS
jgi:hypothetical protein